MISALVLLPAPRECDGEACAAVLLLPPRCKARK
jgi:hypothetical protein